MYIYIGIFTLEFCMSSMCAWSYVYMWAGESVCISVLIKSGI